MKRLIFCLAFSLLLPTSLLPPGGFLHADVTSIDASLDSGFFDLVPDNNFGAHTHVPVGVANNTRINRSVFFMDLASMIPSGATIFNATFEFDVSQQGGSNGQAPGDFDLHRLQAPWDEGTGATNFGEATGDGVTWTNATSSTLWATPGGDFVSTASGSVFVDGANTYSISSAQLVADIQSMIDGSQPNYGFLLKVRDETIRGSAARIGTREGGTPARLIVEFSSIPEPSSLMVVVLCSIAVIRRTR